MPLFSCWLPPRQSVVPMRQSLPARPRRQFAMRCRSCAEKMRLHRWVSPSSGKITALARREHGEHERRSDKRGFDLVFDPGTESDPSEQVARMQALIDAKVDAIFIAPHDETVLAPSDLRGRACIPTFVVDRSVDPTIAVPGDDYVSYLGSDFRLEGEKAAEWLIKATGGKAKIIELEGTVGSSPGCFESRASTSASRPRPACHLGFRERRLRRGQGLRRDETAGYGLSRRQRDLFAQRRHVVRCHHRSRRAGQGPGQGRTDCIHRRHRQATQDSLDGKLARSSNATPSSSAPWRSTPWSLR